MRRTLLAAVLIALTASAEAPAEVIGVRQGRVHALGPFVVSRDATLRAGIRAFGRPGVVRANGSSACRVRWRRRGLEVLFVNLGGGGSACRPGLGAAQTYRATARHWRTRRGLRVGDGVRKLRRLYPRARVRRGRAVLVGVRLPFGGGGRVGTIVAELGGQRVRAFRGYVGAAGE